MKIAINEKIKHRLVGLAVIVSLGIIFAPAMIKKSQIHQHMLHVHMSIPKKPDRPKLAIPNHTEVFHQVKVAEAVLPLKKEKPLAENTLKKAAPDSHHKVSHVLPIPSATRVASASQSTVSPKNSITDIAPHNVKVTVPLNTNQPTGQKTIPASQDHAAIAPASVQHPVAGKVSLKPPLVLKKPQLPVKPLITAASKKSDRTVKGSQILVNPLNQTAKNAYSIQLAYFTSEVNAKSLVEQLKKKGYSARMLVIKKSRGVFYRVLVDTSSDRHQAEMMQKKLASTVNLQGYIVKNGVS